MLRFYPGLSYEAVQNLDSHQFKKLYEAIDVLEAQETLMNFKISMHPHLDDNNRGKVFNAIKEIAYPRKLYKAKKATVSIEALSKMLNG